MIGRSFFNNILQRWITSRDTAGKVTQEEARDKAYSEYEKYKLIQDKSYISDFDRFNDGNDETPLLPFDLNPTK